MYLWYRNGIGAASIGPVAPYIGHVELHFYGQPPRLPGMSFVEIEFMPRAKRCVLAESRPGEFREMTPAEVDVTTRALELLALSARMAFE
jgi:hypothetical protein